MISASPAFGAAARTTSATSPIRAAVPSQRQRCSSDSFGRDTAAQRLDDQALVGGFRKSAAARFGDGADRGSKIAEGNAARDKVPEPCAHFDPPFVAAIKAGPGHAARSKEPRPHGPLDKVAQAIGFLLR
jgi:membrane-bound lytic murein transglycosylase B